MKRAAPESLSAQVGNIKGLNGGQIRKIRNRLKSFSKKGIPMEMISDRDTGRPTPFFLARRNGDEIELDLLEGTYLRTRKDGLRVEHGEPTKFSDIREVTRKAFGLEKNIDPSTTTWTSGYYNHYAQKHFKDRNSILAYIAGGDSKLVPGEEVDHAARTRCTVNSSDRSDDPNFVRNFLIDMASQSTINSEYESMLRSSDRIMCRKNNKKSYRKGDNYQLQLSDSKCSLIDLMDLINGLPSWEIRHVSSQAYMSALKRMSEENGVLWESEEGRFPGLREKLFYQRSGEWVPEGAFLDHLYRLGVPYHSNLSLDEVTEKVLMARVVRERGVQPGCDLRQSKYWEAIAESANLEAEIEDVGPTIVTSPNFDTIEPEADERIEDADITNRLGTVRPTDTPDRSPVDQAWASAHTAATNGMTKENFIKFMNETVSDLGYIRN